MEAKHVINEELKRLEPTDTLCKYCNNDHSKHMDRNHFFPLFTVQDRTNLVVYSSVKFKKLLIGIPRCNQCFVVHKECSYKSWVITVIAAVILAISGFIAFGIFGIFSLILLFALTFVTPMLVEDILIKRKGILTPKEGAMKDPLIQELVIAGWSLNQPTA